MRLDIRDLVKGFLLGAIILVAANPSPAYAHSSTYWFDPLPWDDHTAIPMRIDASIPGSSGSSFEDRIHDGAARWNALCCAGNFSWADAGNGDRADTDPCDWRDTQYDYWVFFGEVGVAGAAASNLHCTVYHQQQDFTDLHSGRLRFDDDVTWHTADTEPTSG